MRVIEVRMEQRRNERAGTTGDSRENPPINGIVRHNSHMRKSGSIPGAVAPRYSRVGIVLNDAAGRRVFSGTSRSPSHLSALAFRRCSMLISLHPRRLSRLEKYVGAIRAYTVKHIKRIIAAKRNARTLSYRVLAMLRVPMDTFSAVLRGRGKREIPEETRRPAASSGTIRTCGDPGATPPGTAPVRLGGRRVV
ncbi:hypothetical protein PR048_030056 [Dryococelus australis]|uniref:Uncharacterized protein n=1 Tax=Dryococelus australis TaxID=614101 RepID=A0ABQ9GAR5_9NEOP|nr:hypothetical protein PR048_030056 [Dryococelus australis]